MRVYVETTIPSYLTARPSRDLIIAAHQAITREWWDEKSPFAELYTSELVLQESDRGGPEAAKERADILKDIPTLDITEDCVNVAEELVSSGLIPPVAAQDAVHIAVATVHDLDVLLTWNCKHIANGAIIKRIHRFFHERGYETPAICTPEELMGG